MFGFFSIYVCRIMSMAHDPEFGLKQIKVKL